MLRALRSRLRRVLVCVVALLPWLLSMFVLYRLEYGDVWTTDTPHRGKISVAILTVGMTLSFLLRSRLLRKRSQTAADN